MFADTAKLVVNLSLAGNFAKQMKGASGALSKFDKSVDRTGTRAFKAGQQIGHGIQNGLKIAAVALGSIAGLLVLSAKEGEDALKVQQLYALAIKNSGKVSADYVKILNDQQTAIMNLAGVDDELVKKQQTVLINMGLTGEQVAKLTPLIFDAAKATGKPVEAITLAVGKAAKGNTAALAKLGIVIPKATKQAKSARLEALELQKAQLKIAEQRAKSVKALTKEQKASFARKKALIEAAILTEKLASAQKKGTKATDAAVTVENELAKRFRGAQAVTSGNLSTRLDVLRESLANLRENAGIKILPVLTKIVDLVSLKLVPAFSNFLDIILPPAIAGLDELLGKISGGEFNSAVTTIFATIKEVAPQVQKAAEITGQVIGTAVDLFRSLPPEIQSLAIAGLAINKLTGGLVTNIAGGLISAVIASFRGLMNVNAATVIVNGPVAGVGGGVGGAAAAAGGGVVSTLAGVAIPVTIAAVSDQALFSLANTQNGTNFEPAGSGPFGIFGSLSAIQNGIDLLLRPPESPAQRALNDAVRNGDRSVIEAIKDQDNSVTVTTNVKTSDIYINGRLFQAGVARTQTIQSGRYAGKPLPTP